MVETPPTPNADSPGENPDAMSWRQVYQECEGGLRSFLRGRLGQEVDVDDCLQSVFVKMVQQSQKAGKNVAVVARRAWLFQVAANEAAGLWRRKASTEKMLRQHRGSNEPPSDAAQQLIVSESATRVRQAVSRLPDTWQDVVRLRIEENLTFQEIAVELNIPLGTALTRMRRALERLKKEMHQEDQT